MSQTTTLQNAAPGGVRIITAVDANDKPYVGDAPVVFSMTDQSIVTFEDHGDGTATITSVGPDGNATLSVSSGTNSNNLKITVSAGAIFFRIGDETSK